MKRLALLISLLCLAAAGTAQEQKEQPTQGKTHAEKPLPAQPMVTAQNAKSVYDFTLASIDGKDVPLSQYKGEVLLIVNVASKCGNTPQYADLEQLYKKYAPRGLRIAAFPANNFKQQEPGTNGEIKEFCQKNYGVTFDMFSKVSVKGDDQCELYKFLTSEQKDPGHAGEIQWNFTKFLIGRDGKVLDRFEPKTKPDDPQVVAAIEKALTEKAPAKVQESPKGEPPKKP